MTSSNKTIDGIEYYKLAPDGVIQASDVWIGDNGKVYHQGEPGLVTYIGSKVREWRVSCWYRPVVQPVAELVVPAVAMQSLGQNDEHQRMMTFFFGSKG